MRQGHARAASRPRASDDRRSSVVRSASVLNSEDRPMRRLSLAIVGTMLIALGVVIFAAGERPRTLVIDAGAVSTASPPSTDASATPVATSVPIAPGYRVQTPRPSV